MAKALHSCITVALSPSILVSERRLSEGWMRRSFSLPVAEMGEIISEESSEALLVVRKGSLAQRAKVKLPQ